MNPYEDMKIFIPSYKRACSVRTFSRLPKEAQDNAFIVVRPQEYKLYAENNPFANIKVLPKWITNLAETRQWIVDNCETRYCFMMDDDLDFSWRPVRGDWHNKYLNTPELKDKLNGAFQEMLDYMKANNIAHCALGQREGSNHEEYLKDWVHNRRYCRAVILDLDTVRKYKYNEDCIGCEDFELALHLITTGHPSAIFYAFQQGHGGSNTPGGLSIVRDINFHNRAMMNLNKLYPNFVRLVERTTTDSWGGATRIDATIMWKKAAESFQPATVNGFNGKRVPTTAYQKQMKFDFCGDES